MTRGRAARAAASALALFALTAPIGGCTTRDRLNPLDPANLETRGEIPGFAAIAGNGVVSLQWTRLTQSGVSGYAVERWRPGEAPALLPGAVFGPGASGAADFEVQNDSTYVYRLIARFTYGDSAFSAPDSASPGPGYVAVLSAGEPAVYVLAPDARDVVAAISASEAYEDADIDRDRNVLWLSDPVSGVVLRRGLYGEIAGVTLSVPGVTDVSVSNLRGVGWIASPDFGVLQAFGPDLQDPVARVSVAGLGHPRVVEAGTLDPTVWVGTDEGVVHRLQPSDGAGLEQWSLGAPIRAIALDQAARAAWVVTARGGVNDLYYLVPGDTARAAVRVGLANVADVEVEEVTRTLWVSERGQPRASAGRVSRVALDGSLLASVEGLEPYGIAIDPGTDRAWVSDLASNRLLLVDAAGLVRRRSPPISVPYGVIAHLR
ncbi:MAG TPA: hypothetical protein VFT32_12860 [Candidatus Eisenbacteria bacterium]|nr:hypothetical protein [Candidatus Eisenbacteria bacterium]